MGGENISASQQEAIETEVEKEMPQVKPCFEDKASQTGSDACEQETFKGVHSTRTDDHSYSLPSTPNLKRKLEFMQNQLENQK